MQNIEWFINPVTEQYADFDGTATRQQYWMFVLWSFLVAIVVVLISGVIDLAILSVAFYLAIIVPSLAIGARRLHDANMSGWWQLISLVPLIGGIILIVLFIKETVVEGNKYRPSVATVGAVPVPPPELSQSNKPE